MGKTLRDGVSHRHGFNRMGTLVVQNSTQETTNAGNCCSNDCGSCTVGRCQAFALVCPATINKEKGGE